MKKKKINFRQWDYWLEKDSIVYFYNWKLYDLRASERRNIYFNNFEIGGNYIRSEENVSKMFPRVLHDLKYESRVVKLACHEVGQKHGPFFVDVMILYIGLVEIFEKGMGKQISFDKCFVGINRPQDWDAKLPIAYV